MRVIAGKYRSRKLVAPPGMETRPTSDRLRETLFNVLALRTPGSVLLDVFAGSGGVGIEALSRGARKAYLCEGDKKALRAIRENLETLGIGEEAEVLPGDALDALRALAAQGVQVDVVFLDPPYRKHGAYERTLEFLGESGMLAADAWVIAEHTKHFDPGPRFGSLQRFRTLKQGDAVLSFYRLTMASAT
ncbi:MAG: 16S rRNA (guanine(966)-N(2))-methyltransferase RsmD [Acidobacteriales bacterium]|nr:16S rRNA (guanine(966)-N(2))-methyltransferase RsmD [Terriglobales bacterium]